MGKFGTKYLKSSQQKLSVVVISTPKIKGDWVRTALK